VPLTPLGLPRVIAPTKARDIIRQRGVGKARFANAGMDDPAFSARNSTCPPLAARTASPNIRRHRA